MSLSKGKRAVIVTGASRGLGKEIALRFGRAGDSVLESFLSHEQEATEIVEEIARIVGEALQSRDDVGIAAEVDRLMDDEEKRLGTIDVLINNAGVTKNGMLLRMTEDDWDDVISTNLMGPIHCIRAAAKIIAKTVRARLSIFLRLSAFRTG